MTSEVKPGYHISGITRSDTSSGGAEKGQGDSEPGQRKLNMKSKGVEGKK
jgi:hypothetical protein